MSLGTSSITMPFWRACIGTSIESFMVLVKSRKLLSSKIYPFPSSVSTATTPFINVTSFCGSYASRKGLTLNFLPLMNSKTLTCFPAQELSACESIPNLQPLDFSSSVSWGTFSVTDLIVCRASNGNCRNERIGEICRIFGYRQEDLKLMYSLNDVTHVRKVENTPRNSQFLLLRERSCSVVDEWDVF